MSASGESTADPVQAFTVPAAMWEGDRLSIGYNAETGRVVRYTSRLPRSSATDVRICLAETNPRSA